MFQSWSDLFPCISFYVVHKSFSFWYVEATTHLSNWNRLQEACRLISLRLCCETLLWLCCVAGGFWLQQPGFDPRLSDGGFVVDRVALLPILIPAIALHSLISYHQPCVVLTLTVMFTEQAGWNSTHFRLASGRCLGQVLAGMSTVLTLCMVFLSTRMVPQIRARLLPSTCFQVIVCCHPTLWWHTVWDTESIIKS